MGFIGYGLVWRQEIRVWTRDAAKDGQPAAPDLWRYFVQLIEAAEHRPASTPLVVSNIRHAYPLASAIRIIHTRWCQQYTVCTTIGFSNTRYAHGWCQQYTVCTLVGFSKTRYAHPLVSAIHCTDLLQRLGISNRRLGIGYLDVLICIYG